jgi:hypothetical protein
MITRSLGKDPLTGLETIHHYDEVTHETHIEYKQDIGAIIERNKSLHNTEHQKIGCKQEWMHAACIPEVIQIKWMKEFGIKDICSEESWPVVRRLLNSPDYKYLKTGNMKL